jgi:hypothetical protein
MIYITDDRAQFIKPGKLVQVLKYARSVDPELYAGLIDAICRAAGWSIPALIQRTRTRIPAYATGPDSEEWEPE